VKDQWHLLQEVTAKTCNQIEASAEVPPDSLWFSGHFPGEPILPGVALVYLAEQAIIRQAKENGEAMSLNALRKVRFTQPVRPGAKLAVHISRDDTGAEIVFSFKIIFQESVVCSGSISAQKVIKP